MTRRRDVLALAALGAAAGAMRPAGRCTVWSATIGVHITLKST